MGTHFTDPDAWAGGFYELAMQVGSAPERVAAALTATWSSAVLEGCYARRDIEPAQQARVAPTSSDEGWLYGIALIPSGDRVACATCYWGGDWLDVCLPMGALERAYPVGAYPFGDFKNLPRWQPELDGWLFTLATRVFDAVPFSLALIGHEVSAELDAETLKRTGIPATRCFGIAWPAERQLVFYPPNVP